MGDRDRGGGRGGGRGNGEGVSLRVRNLPHATTEAEVKALFSKYGETLDTYIPRVYGTNRSTGFCFVKYRTKEEGERAMAESPPLVIGGR